MIRKPLCVLWDWIGTLCVNDKPAAYAHELLQLFASNNIQQYIVTNGIGAEIASQASLFGFGKYINDVIGIELDLPIKPAPDMALHAMKIGNISDASQVIFIGDSQTDLICAKQAGCMGVSAKLGLENIWLYYQESLK